MEQTHFAPEPLQRSESFKNYSVILTSLAKLVRESGYPVEAFNPELPSRFPGLDRDQQLGIVKGLESYLNICTAAATNGISLKQNGLSLAWWAIKSFKLRPLSDVFSHLQPTDIIEIYDQDHVQIFRTFDFFKYIGYSLDELFTHSWWELYERSELVTAQMVEVATKVMKEKKAVTLLAPFPTHTTSEKFSSRPYVAQVESRLVSTLVDDQGTPKAYINAFSLISFADLPAPRPRPCLVVPIMQAD